MLLAAADRGRAWLLRHGAPITVPFVRSRDLRVLAATLFACVTTLAAMAGAAGWLLLLGPLALGAPHLIFEARYLFFQDKRLRRAAPVAILVLQALSAFAGIGIYTLAPACLALTLSTAGPSRRRTAALAALTVVAELAVVIGPTWSRFALLHAHNCIPIVVWLAWRKRPWRVSLAVTACMVAAAAIVLGGGLDALRLRTPLSDAAFSLTRITDAVAANFPGVWRKRCLLFFGFTQAIHYAIWIRLIPEEARDRETPRSFRASWMAFRRDTGASFAWLALASAIVVPLAALAIGAVRARSLYVTASEFHATVEVALLVSGASRARSGG